MTQNVNGPVDDDDFEDATDEFPSKFDLKDRLVMIYPTGKTGTRQGENGKPYPWVETTTVVLDDGPDGYQAMVLDYDTQTQRANRIPSVAEDGPQVLENFQWSAGGVVARLAGKEPAKHDGVPVGLLGRIDAKAQKGKAAAWRPNTPTDADRELAKSPDVTKVRLAARDAIVAALKAAEVEDAF